MNTYIYAKLNKIMLVFDPPAKKETICNRKFHRTGQKNARQKMECSHTKIDIVFFTYSAKFIF